MGAALTMALSSLATLPASGARAAASGPTQPATRRAGAAAAVRTVLSFTFDDGDVDQLAAARVLHRYGLHGTFYIITGAVGAPNYVTLPDLHTLAAEGDEIGGHTVSHVELPHVPWPRPAARCATGGTFSSSGDST